MLTVELIGISVNSRADTVLVPDRDLVLTIELIGISVNSRADRD